MFSGGMNKDLSKSVFKDGSYIHAENFTLITDTGLSTGSLRSSNGNESYFTIPECSNVVEITLSVTSSSTVTIVFVNTLTFFTSTYNNITSTEDLGAAMQADPLLSSNYYGVAYNNDRIVVYSLLSNNVLYTNSIFLTGSITFPNTISINNNYVPAQLLSTNPLKILGWVTIRDEIFLFTSSEVNDPVTNPISQIWKLTYDKYTYNPVITLIYNNSLSFTLAHPIPNPGGGVGNFETPQIKKIYWTDNFNKPRYCNTADTNLMATDPAQLDMVARVAHGIGTIKEVLLSGNIKSGIYYVSGRVKKTSGGSASYIIPSNPITVINELETVSYINYEARDTGVFVTKSISAVLFNLDTNYDRVEPVIIYKKTKDSTPDIYSLPSVPIPSNGIVDFKYTGSEVTIPVLLEEFLFTNLNFETVKTINSKNNMLFFGNVKYGDFDVDFDARAYRFKGINASTNPKTFALKNVNGTIVYNNFNTSQLNSIPFNADAIQDLNMQAPDSCDNYIFQADGVTYGGEGINVKYRFVPMNSTYNDTSINKNFRTKIEENSSNSAPYGSVDLSTTVIDLDSNPGTLYDQIFNTNTYFNASSPYARYGVKGYQRDEMYRFGIVFYSNTGEPSYVHWVGDIRMPKSYMPDPYNPNPLNRNALKFQIAGMDDETNVSSNNANDINAGTKEFYGHNLGIEFTVDVTSIRNDISGYSIVRVPRTENDKTILGQGVLSPIWYSGSGSFNGAQRFYAVAGGKGVWEFNGSSSYQHPTPAPNNDWNIPHELATLASPEFLFKGAPTYSPGDQVDFIQVNESFWEVNNISINGTGTSTGNSNFSFCIPSGQVLKFYTPYENSFAPKATGNPNNIFFSNYLDAGTPLEFNQSKVMGVGASASIPSGPINNSTTVYNYSYEYNILGCASTDNDDYLANANGNAPRPRSLGGSKLLLSWQFLGNRNLGNVVKLGNNWVDWKDVLYGYDFVTSADGHTGPTRLKEINPTWYIANYRRPTAVQYGGLGYSSRSFNEYITTGHVQLVNNTTTTNTSMVFGGDTVITLFDYTTHLRNRNYTSNDELHIHGGFTSNPSGQYDHTFNQILLTAVECSFPVELRKQNSLPASAVNDGYTNNPRCAPNKSTIYNGWPASMTGGSGPNTTAEWTEVYEYEDDYDAENDIVKFFPKPDPYLFQNVFDVRTHRSQVKSNGELVDSWTIFKQEDYLDLDTYQGPLNNLIIFRDKLLGFQDKGIAMLSVNERSVTQDASGSDIILGSGGVLARYDYISKIIGSRHQFSFTTSNDAVFWFDMNTKNMYKMQGAEQASPPVAITVSKGMASYMSNNLNGIIQVNDNPYKDRGITATYDFRYNEAIMTFKDSIFDDKPALPNYQPTNLLFVNQDPNTGYYNFNVPSFQGTTWLSFTTEFILFVKNTNTYYYANLAPAVPGYDLTLNITNPPTLNTTDLITVYRLVPNSFTVGYNDFIDAYTSFYSFTPSVYINDQVSIFSPDDSLGNVYRHDVGPHATYYGTTYPSKLTLIQNQSPTETKVFDNYEIVSESIDSSGTHITTDIFNRIRLYNDYQNTDFQTLPIDTLTNKPIAKRKERTWNISNLRNRVLYNNPDPNIFDPNELSTYDPINPGDKVFGERMRDKYLIVDLEYDNLDNYNFIVHTFKTVFRKSAR